MRIYVEVVIRVNVISINELSEEDIVMLKRCYILLLLGMCICGIACSCFASEADVKGKWMRTTPDGTRHIVKELGEEKETLSAFDVNGELIYRHVVDYKVEPLNGLSVFKYWNRQISVDTSKTEEEIAAQNQELKEEASEPVQYLFKIQGNQWIEVHQMWKGDESTPSMTVYSRLTDDAELPWKSDASLPENLRPKAVMNYFAGQWESKGKVGDNEYHGRCASDWDLHHQAMIGRFEFFGAGGGGGTLHSYWMWDNVTKRIVDRQFSSWGVYRDASYKIVADGEFFKLVGTSVQHAADATTSADVEVSVVDQNHYTWRVMPHDKSRPDMVEETYRITAMPK
jgi:hypothetical protein